MKIGRKKAENESPEGPAQAPNVPARTPKKAKKGLKLSKKAWIIITASVVVIAGSVTTFLVLASKNKEVEEPQASVVEDTPEPEPEPEPIVYYDNLAGRVIESEAGASAAVTGIMIENSPDARPQSGLKDSGVVFEAQAEGGITRFLVLYQSEKPQLIGPVRSVRLYYVEWATPFRASIAHVGGSDDALALVRNGSYRDIDQFFNSGSYWRATDRYAPHNVYTNFDNLDALNAKKGYLESSFVGFSRKDDELAEPKEEPEDGVETEVAIPTLVTQITVKISSAPYNSSYVYDEETNSYLRSQAGKPHLDREQGQISPKVVIGMMVDQKHKPAGGEQITTVGAGRAYIFQDGKVVDGKWRKMTRDAQIEFFDEAGEPMKLNRGQTWISAVPNGSGSVSWK